MKENAIIGVDIGTTSTKTIAFDHEGNILVKASREYPLYSEPAGRAEQDPDEIYEALVETLRSAVKTISGQGWQVEAVAFSAAMHSLIAVDEDGHPLTRSITWADQRSVEEADRLRENGQGLAIYRRTGTPIHPMSPLTKLIWFKKNDPDLYQKTHKWISLKEYVFYRLFNEFIIDYSIASATGLFHLENLDWDEEALQLTGLEREQLSRPVPTTYTLKGLDSKIASHIGLDEETPFIVGASDGVLANLGVGAVENGSVACSIGTSGAVRTVVSKPVTDPEGKLFCYALTENQWVIGGPINNGGIAFRWLRDNIYEDLADDPDAYNRLTDKAEQVAPGAGGLMFLPYLTGERAPYWNADMKGVFFGLTLNHGRNDMIRSVLEGVIYQLDMVVEALRNSGVRPQEFRATGGFTKSALWRQIMADVFDRDILVPSNTSSSCFGAALLGMKALGWIEDFSSIKEMVPIQAYHKPIDSHVRVYRRYKPIFGQLVEKLQPDFLMLSNEQKLELS
ncbi:MAG TPA: gluconokinase [Bacillales bacterium]|nr:gluconokinase [Bacillales bacterium]